MWRTSPVSYIYNPLNQTEEELLKNYVVREREFNTIFDDIRGSKMTHPEPHYIIQGQRGQGKTTLLLKIYYEIKKDKELSKFVIPIMFNEEQYHINTLFGLWVHTAEKLEEENQHFSRLYEKIESAYEAEDSEMKAFNLLESALKDKKKKLILLMDNIGQLLDKLTLREQLRLREVLIASPEIRIIGASAVVLEYTYDYSKPFYELFRIIPLEGLTQKESVMLLIKLGEHYKQENIEKMIEIEPGRVEALRRLTGGVPRTIVLLFEIFVDDENGNAFQDLEFILDRVTPLYKHRMDDLSSQQQKIVDAIALNWDAMPAKEIAKKTRMESKAVSAQLKLLERNRIIHKIKTTTKNHFYQVTERFFNIWYLMRCGRRRGKSRVLWLVHFLQSWCSESDLSERTLMHIFAIKKGTLSSKHAFYLTEALADTRIPESLQHYLITHTRSFLEKKDRNLLKELSKSDTEIFKEGIKNVEKGELEKALQNFEAIKNKDDIVFYNMALLFLRRNNIKKTEEYFLLAVEQNNPSAMNNLARLYFVMKKNKTKALDLIKRAVKLEKGKLRYLHNLSIILLWNNEIEESLKIEIASMQRKEYITLSTFDGNEYFILLMAKNQYYLALKIFKENPFNLKERIKPVYYALMYFLKDDFPNEYKKMGAELKETVEEIIAAVKKWEKDYA